MTTVRVECYGAGGGGGGSTAAVGAAGGGGGAYARLNALSVTPGTIYTVTVGAAGGGGAANGAGNDGGDSWFSTSGTVIAKGGGGGPIVTGSGTGGAAGSSIGDVVFSGGNGGAAAAAATGGAGGGSAAGDIGAGNVGGVATAGGNVGGVHVSMGGKGGAGAGSATTDGAAGDRYGGGGGGSGSGASNTGVGGNGVTGAVYLTWSVASVGLPTISLNDIDTDTNKNYQNLAVDDGDYFIQYGSEYMIQEYKVDWTNNTDIPTFTWKGRSTYDTRISPFLIQIYNVNSATWETLARENRQLPDVDFTLVVKQTTNISNYYDASNIVTFRTYQQVL